MSSTENPINAPLPAPPVKQHNRQMGDEKRLRLCNGPFVDAHTLAQLAEWHGKNISYGVLLDRLVTMAVEAGYDPVTRTYHKQTKSQKAGLAQKKTAPRR